MSYNPDTIVEQIRQAYPNPVSIYNKRYEPGPSYCVGGAVMNFFELPKMGTGFVLPGELRSAFHQLNPQLPWSVADVFAEGILRANDLGNFEEAWSYVHQALTYTG